MKGLLGNFRGKNRSPPSSRGWSTGSTGREDDDLDAALAASVAESGPSYPTASAPAKGDDTYLSDEDTAVAAAIGASLDAYEAYGAYENGTRGEGSGDSTGPPRSYGDQDFALLTDEPLLPPTGATAAARGVHSSAAAAGSSAGRQRRGVSPVTAPGVERRRPTNEDEALARRLHEQWISEDTAAGGGNILQFPDGFVKLHGNPSISNGVRICAGCGHPIMERTFKHGPGGIYHAACLPTMAPDLPPCSVCHNNLPMENGRIHFYRHNYFNDLYCPWHHDNTPRCYSCMRLEPDAKPGGGEEGPFAELQDGRMVCMTCAKTAVVDSAEGSPAFQDVCDFLELELLLPVPREMREVPILVVDSPTLNEQTHRDTSHGGGKEIGIPTTRGLTLAEVATVMHMAGGALQFDPTLGRFEVGRPTPVNLGEQRAVTAILVLCGMPYASFSSILAHEAMHAVMKLDPSYPTRLPSQVEEGVCQLIAWLWLERLAGKRARNYFDSPNEYGGGWQRRPGEPPSDEHLRGFFAHQIKTDVSAVYGDGFRRAKAVYDTVGLEALLYYIKQYHSFPEL